jgi:hypothetical protein
MIDAKIESNEGIIGRLHINDPKLIGIMVITE